MRIDVEARGKRMSRTWVRLGVIYLMVGAGMGLSIAATQAFQYAPAQAHIILLGWMSMAGLLCDRWALGRQLDRPVPAARKQMSRLAKDR